MFRRPLYVALLVGLAAAVVQDAAAQSPSLVLSDSSLEVPEAGSADYTVKLATQPSADVTVSIGGTSGTDLTVSRTSLTFTTSNWDMAQGILVRAARDDDATHDSATLTHTALGGGYDMVSADLPVTVTDITRMRLVAVIETVTEGESKPIRARLPMPLDDDVTITVMVAPNGGRDDEYELSANTMLTIAAGDTESTGDVVFTSLDDFTDTGVRYFNGTLTPDHPRVDADTKRFAVLDDDNTISLLQVAPSQIFENGGTATLRGAKLSLHEGVVKMEVSLEPSGRATLSGDTLTFPPGALYATETLTITAVDNTSDETDQVITISATVTEGRGIRTPAPVQLTIVDDDGMSPEVAFVLTPPRVREGLASTVTALASAPLDNEATITVSASPGHADTRTDDYALSADPVLTIPAGGTRSTGTVTIATVDDQIHVGSRRRVVTVSGTVTGGGGVSNPADQTLTVLEDDQRVPVAVIATPATIAEGGVSTITLRSQGGALPADVNVTIRASSDEVELSADPVLMIAEGETESTGTVTLTAVQDTNMQNGVVTVSGVPDNGFVRVVFASVYTVDDDATEATLTVSPVPSRFYEGQTSTIIAALSRTLSDDVTVTIGVDEAHVDHTATADDYTLSGDLTLTIPAGDMRVSGPTLTASNDEYYGPRASRKVIWNIVSATGIDRFRVIKHSDWTIQEDEEQPRVTLAVTPASVAENNGQSTVTASLNTIVESDVEVTVTTEPAVAAESDDFTQTGTLLTIPAGQKTSTGTVTISAVDDDVDGPDKNLVVRGAVEVVGMEQSGLVWFPYDESLTIQDDETVSTEVALSVNPTSVEEDDAATTVTVTAELDEDARAIATTVTVAVGATSDAATEGTDYATVNNFMLTIAGGATSGTGTFALTPTDDTLGEGNEEVSVTGSATGLTVTGTELTITDDETVSTEVTLSVNPTSVREDAGATPVTVTAELDEDARAIATTVTVVVGETGDTATEGTDYGTIADLAITIAAGATSGTGTFTLTPTDDTLGEGNEEVSVTGSATGLTVTGTELTITDDETVSTGITLTVNPTSVEEDDAATTVTVTATLDEDARAIGTTVTVGVGATSDAATEGTDYGTVADLAITIAAGATSGSGTFTLTPTDDTLGEGNEEVSVTGSATGLTVTGTELTITDDETVSTGITLTVNPTSVEEDDAATTVTVTATLDEDARAIGTTVTVAVGETGDSATEGTDYTAVSDLTVMIAAGSTSGTGTFTLTPTDDTLGEGSETVSVTGSATGLTVTGTELTLTDDETVSTEVTLSVNPTSVREDASPTTVTVTATLDEDARVSATTVTVAVGETGDTATEGTDYATVNNLTLTIAVGATSGTGTFTLTPTDDTLGEDDEKVSVTGSASGLTVRSTELTLTDDETVSTGITLTVAPTSVGEDDGATMVTVTARLSGAARSGATTVTVAAGALDDTATEGTDYATVNNFTLTIAAGATSGTGTFTLTPTDDTLGEGDEKVSVTGSASGLTVTGTELTLTDDETGSTEVTLSVSPTSVREDAGGATVTVTATLDEDARASATTVTVGVGETGDTATEGTDYATVADLTVTIPGGSTSGTGTFTLTPTDDSLVEGDEEVSVTGSAAGVTVTGTDLTIADNEMVSTEVTLSVNPTSVREDAGATTVTVTAMLDEDARASATVVTVSVGAESDGATEGTDYATVPDLTVTIAAGATSGTGTFTLTPIEDEAVEGPETLDVSGTMTAGLTVAAAVLTIEDDDEPNGPPVFDRASYRFDLPENRSGRDAPVVLGTVGARDPDGDRFRYALVAGDRSRFSVSPDSGTFSYIGGSEDFESGPSQFELQVSAQDNQYQVTAEVIVRVVDVPEPPEAADDHAETPEDTPRVIDVLANDRDPDGDRLRVASVSAPEHGTATVESNGVRYTPSLNWHGEDRFTYTAADPGGLMSRATVRVTVTPVNDPPEAVDDEAETLEDVPAVVDVLANDTDVDGDTLQVVSIGSAGHGTTALADGGVRYAPDLNWYGTDRFTYTIADPEGLTAKATVTMTVHPVNDAPEAVGVIRDQSIEEGGAPVTVDVTPYFRDVDGDVLTYEAVSSDESAVTVTVSGAVVELTAVVAGTATVTVTASDAEGLTATQRFGVTVGDRLVRGVLTDTLAALGRGHLSSARVTVGRRLETGGGGVTRMMVAGQSLSLDAWNQMGAGGLEQSHELGFRAATLQQRRSATDLVGTSADPRLRRSGAGSVMGGSFADSGGGDRLLQGTDLLLSFGGRTGASSSGAVGGRWTVWGQGDLQSFRGAPVEGSGYEGDLRTGYLGVDVRLNERWLAGVAVARSGGAGDWQVGASSGRLSTELTVLHPYVRWGGREWAVWGLAGVGRGTVENVRSLTGGRGDGALSLGLGLVEGRRRLATTAGLEVDLRGEASWARLRTGGGEETVDGLEAVVRRVRTGVEVTVPLRGPGGLQVAPFGAVSTRHDGGAGQTGVGLEVAGGARVSGGRLRLEAQGRKLVLHTATEYEEQGVSVVASVGGGEYEAGWTASLRPRWGAPGYGAESLWQDWMRYRAPGPGRDDAGVDARIGYGLRLPAGRLLMPFGGYGRTGSGQRVQGGARLGMAGLFGGDPSSPLHVEFLGERYGGPGGGADYRFTLFGIINFGARPRTPCNPAEGACVGTASGRGGAPDPPPAAALDEPGRLDRTAAPVPMQ